MAASSLKVKGNETIKKSDFCFSRQSVGFPKYDQYTLSLLSVVLKVIFFLSVVGRMTMSRVR